MGKTANSEVGLLVTTGFIFLALVLGFSEAVSIRENTSKSIY